MSVTPVSRQNLISRIVMILVILFALRLSQFCIFRHGIWSERADQLIVRSLDLEPVRGRILTGTGEVLARSRTIISVATDNLALRKTGCECRVAAELSRILNIPQEPIISRIYSRRNVSWVARDISREQFAELMRSQRLGALPAVHIKRELDREYPRHPVASSLVGFVRFQREPGYDVLGPFRAGRGMEGLERSYNRELSGQPGQFKYYQNRFSAPEAGSYQCTIPVQDGLDLVCTLDLQLQSILREELIRSREEHQAKSVMGIILNPLDGGILASASVENIPESFDSEYRATTPSNCYPPAARRNQATTSVFEPGSIWKPVIMSLALEHDLVVPDEMIPWSDPIRVGGKSFYDWRKFESPLRLGEILTHSSNVGIIKVSKRLFAALTGEEIALELHRLGFHRRLPVDFASRSQGRLLYQLWSNTSVGAVAEGYEMGVTLAQMAAFYACLANGGYRVDPHFGLKLLDPASGKMVKNLQPPILEQTLSTETVNYIRGALMDCVDHGTGKNGSLADYGILAAGKTATAKLFINGTYASGKYRASFAGFFPAETPQYVMVVSVEEPSAGKYYGGSVAAPLFKQIAVRIVEEVMHISPINPDTASDSGGVQPS